MTLLILGLVLFLGTHSVRIVAEPWRTATRARLGANAWKGLYSLVSIVGFVLIVWGYGLARQQPLVLWEPPLAMRHLAALLTLVAFVMLAAAYVPGNAIKARLRHPMVLGVKVWAFAHLLANGTLADLLLFGSFLLWAVLCFRAARGRDRAAGTLYPAGSAARSLLSVAVGLAAWAGFAFWAHGAWIGVRPFG
ncbi:MAG TPA: NnrU family protein [Methylibium sp.]|nr:NnrU family protein [Methylibium sp.]